MTVHENINVIGPFPESDNTEDTAFHTVHGENINIPNIQPLSSDKEVSNVLEVVILPVIQKSQTVTLDSQELLHSQCDCLLQVTITHCETSQHHNTDQVFQDINSIGTIPSIMSTQNLSQSTIDTEGISLHSSSLLLMIASMNKRWDPGKSNFDIGSHGTNQVVGNREEEKISSKESSMEEIRSTDNYNSHSTSESNNSLSEREKRIIRRSNRKKE
jgi:hypothetical protein